MKVNDNQTTVADKLTDVTSKLLDIVMLTKEVQVSSGGLSPSFALRLTEFERINQLLFPRVFCDHFRVLEANYFA